ncbi:hypothetical protein pdam_00016078 [Pocillopora damicornis]|uniref:Uncharacterized protein n=1 Tax=Pocillopora damicornis TaxID=46731 RepID=A0A3M6TVL4_POCDA|nr:hypothetical protein pdam_00016078 [Pocillopora damicornis]
MTKIVASKSIFDAKGSIGMNSTPILPDVRRKESTPRSRGRTSNSIIVTAVIPGSLAGRVAAERDVDAGDEGQQSISEDHTIHGSEENRSVENLSVYELAERGNSSSVTENQASVCSAAGLLAARVNSFESQNRLVLLSFILRSYNCTR